jgi:hypothetical protein
LTEIYHKKGRPVKIRRGPATVYGSFLHDATVFYGKAVKSVDHEPGDLPVLEFTMNYEDRRVFLA